MGPANANIRQSRTAVASSGTAEASHTTDSSDGVRVMEQKPGPIAHSGSGLSGGNRQTACRSRGQSDRAGHAVCDRQSLTSFVTSRRIPQPAPACDLLAPPV